ncbi:MAG: hypothetical protein ACRDOE_26500, partial [Streptosporangiaceae bacterium]
MRRRVRSGGSAGRGGWRLAALVAAAGTAAGMVLVPVAANAAPAALPSNCTQTGQTVACVYAATGATQAFTPPAGVGSVTVSLSGASGGLGGTFNGFGGAGGKGATVSGSVGGLTGQPLT